MKSWKGWSTRVSGDGALLFFLPVILYSGNMVENNPILVKSAARTPRLITPLRIQNISNDSFSCCFATVNRSLFFLFLGFRDEHHPDRCLWVTYDISAFTFMRTFILLESWENQNPQIITLLWKYKTRIPCVDMEIDERANKEVGREKDKGKTADPDRLWIHL